MRSHRPPRWLAAQYGRLPLWLILLVALSLSIAVALGSGTTVLVSVLLLFIVGSRLQSLRRIDERTGELRRQALHDGLTGLPNRALILDRAEQTLAGCRRDGRRPAALYIDLDGFKHANDTLGHAAGDRLLQAVADRLRGVVRDGDTLGRISGDEFIVLTAVEPSGPGPEVVAERLLEAMREPFETASGSNRSFAVTASIGIALGDRPTPEDLLRDADIALYQAKANGRDRMALFDPGMHETVRQRLQMEMDLRTALEASEFVLEFQPTFDLREVGVTGVEALLRWNHPTRGVVAPLDFLPLAEETGLIVPIGHWVLEEACRHAASWHRQGHRIRVAVNVSRRQLQREKFVDEVIGVLDLTGLDGRFLVLEVAEAILMRDGAGLVDRLGRLRSLGLSIAVDNFGVGYSSLSYLKQFPIESLKIDRSFIDAMTDTRESTALIRTLVQLGKDLGIETLAEGIEEHGQFNRLRAEECDSGQGFLFARPLAASAVGTFLETWTQSEPSSARVLQSVPEDAEPSG